MKPETKNAIIIAVIIVLLVIYITNQGWFKNTTNSIPPTNSDKTLLKQTSLVKSSLGSSLGTTYGGIRGFTPST